MKLWNKQWYSYISDTKLYNSKNSEFQPRNKMNKNDSENHNTWNHLRCNSFHFIHIKSPGNSGQNASPNAFFISIFIKYSIIGLFLFCRFHKNRSFYHVLLFYVNASWTTWLININFILSLSFEDKGENQIIKIHPNSFCKASLHFDTNIFS